MDTTAIAAPEPPPSNEPTITVGRIDPALKEEIRRREAGLPSNGDYKLPERPGTAVAEPVTVLTPAMLRLHDLRQRRNQSPAPPTRIEAREYLAPGADKTETWYFARLDYAPLALARHDVSEVLEDTADIVLRAMTRAVLTYVVCKSATDPSPYFQSADVEAWLNEPAGSEFFELIDWLTNIGLELNGDIVPKPPVTETAGTPSSISQPAPNETGSSPTETTPIAAK